MTLALLQDAEATSALARAVLPWSRLFSHSKAVSAAVLFLHLVPLVTAAGAAVVADRSTLRASRLGADARTMQLVALARTHRVVLAGLALSLTSGILLFLSDVDNFRTAIAFWTKLGMVTLLLANGFLMTRTEAALAADPASESLWGRLRTVSQLSMALWLGTVLNGVILATYA